MRVPFVLTAVFDSAACALLAQGAGGFPLGSSTWLAWALLAATSALLYLAGMASNDLADMERDREIAPGRPLPSGTLGRGSVAALVVLFFGGALALGGGPDGSRLAVAATIAFALLYNVATKRFAVPGAITMGAVRFANASIAVLPLVFGGHAPFWVLLAPLALGIYSSAITLLSTTETEFAPQRVLHMRVLTCIAFACASIVSWCAAGIPTLGAVIAFGVVTSTACCRTPREGPPKRQVLEMLLGMYFLEAAIASGGGQGHLGLGFAALAVAVLALRLTWWMLRALAPRTPSGPTVTPPVTPTVPPSVPPSAEA